MSSPLVAFGRTIALVGALLPASCAAAEEPVAFTTFGGDAWTFEKLVDFSVKPGACDAVTITSPRATTTVEPVNGRARARVPFDAGDNRLQAQCRKDGAPSGNPIEQHWFVRLRDSPVARVRVRVTGSEVVLDAGASEQAP